MDICLTIDVDWAPAEVLARALEPLRQAGLAYTMFATDNCPPRHDPACELAWHPNLVGRPAAVELARYGALFPGCRGLRPHRLHPGDLDALGMARAGIAWVSASYAPGDHSPGSFQGLLPDFHINWGDNLFFREGLEPAYQRMRAAQDGVFLINFHPIHLFLNTCSQQQYQDAKPHYHHPDRLEDLINRRERGVGEVFAKVLDLSGDSGVRFLTISQVWSGYRS